MLEWIDRIRGALWFIFGPIEWPLVFLQNTTGTEITAWGVVVYDIFAIAAVLWFLKWGYDKARDLLSSGRMADKGDVDALLGKNTDLAQALNDPDALRATTAFLKKHKEWGKLAEAYAAIGHHEKAAQFFRKAKDHRRAARHMSDAGKPGQAAKSLMRAGEYEDAGRCFERAENYKKAAKAFAKAGRPGLAGRAWSEAGNAKKAAALFQEYFASPRDDAATQSRVAHACHRMLKDPKATEALDDETKGALLPHVAKAYEAEDRHDLAAELYEHAGDRVRAAESYIKAGKLEKAAAAYKAAGKPKEAARIGGRYYEKMKRWKEAAMAYAGGEEFVRAAECFAKADEPVRAAEYFARSGDHARSGLMYARARRCEEAIGELQQVAADDPSYESTRGVLGRCFYETHDYAHCAATLDNHLLNKRVEKENIDLFYMLALAKEQVGDLQAARDILYKIGGVDRSYRDLDTRISSIDSRISMLGSQMPQGTPAPQPTGNGGNPAVMSMVQNTLGERYDIEKELGRGGMGVVYLARDKQLDRKVALKFLGTLVDSNEEYRHRFVREAKTAAKINHPNIVAIYDISASEGKAYIAMEYIEGKSLQQLIKEKGKLPVREALVYMAQACSALYAIHRSGIVHRDIKPDNIVIAKGGLVKVMDFGLAKAEDNRITKSNIVMGTPCYMAPEQAQGKDVDERADIYAMGLVLYEMLTGKVVFADGDVLTRQITEMPPPLSELIENGTPELDAFAFKCIAKKPEDRFKNCKVLVEELRQIGS